VLNVRITPKATVVRPKSDPSLSAIATTQQKHRYSITSSASNRIE